MSVLISGDHSVTVGRFGQFGIYGTTAAERISDSTVLDVAGPGPRGSKRFARHVGLREYHFL